MVKRKKHKNAAINKWAKKTKKEAINTLEIRGLCFFVDMF